LPVPIADVSFLRFYANEGESESFNATSTGNPILARPYFDTNLLVNSEAALLVAYPGISGGSIGMSSKNDVIGGDVLIRSRLRPDCRRLPGELDTHVDGQISRRKYAAAGRN
jgi:hypothetical protein